MPESLAALLRGIPPVFDSSVGHLVVSLAVLVATFGFALIVALALRRVLIRVGLGGRIAKRIQSGVRTVLGPERAVKHDVERTAARILFWGVLILALAALASVFDFSAAEGVSGGLLPRVMGLAIQLGQALLLLVAAWTLAALLRRAVRAALDAVGVDEPDRRDPKAAPSGLSHTVPEAIYWIVLLLFLPSLLATLGLSGVLLPVETVVDEIVLFLPNLLLAVIIFLVGWFVARIARAAVTNLLATLGLDRALDRLGVRRVLGSRTPSALLGGLVYVLVLFQVILIGLERMNLDVITGPAAAMLGRGLAALPLVIVAAALLLTAYVVGRIVADVVRDLLREAGFDHFLHRIGVTGASMREEFAPSNIVRVLILTVIVLFAAIEAASHIGFDRAAELLTRLLVFAGQFLLGVAFVGLGVFLANLSARAIAASSMPQARLLSLAARAGILLFATAVGLRQMGIANEIIEIAFGIVLGAVAVAFAVAFGLGGREAAARQIDRWQSRLSEERES